MVNMMTRSWVAGKELIKVVKIFFKFMNISPESKKFYDKINNYSFFKRYKKIFLVKKNYMTYLRTNLNLYFKKLFGSQSGKKITKIKTDLNKNILYLDIDFSISGKGYTRGPHRDRDLRIINFLIYLNNLTPKDGGNLQLFNVRDKKFKFK